MTLRLFIGRFIGLCILVLTCATVPACGTKVQDCNKVIGAINNAVERIKAVEMNAKELDKSIEQMKAFATIVQEEANRLRALQIGTVELQQHVDAYLAMTTETVAAAKEIVMAMEGVLAATAKAKKLQKDLEASMNGLEKACKGSTCLKVMKRIAKTNAPEDDDKLAAELDGLAADLAAMKTGKDKVDAAVAAHAANTKALADTLREMKLAQQTGDAAQKQLNGATDKEEPLIKEINALCGAR
jgi:hypothetical protein